MTDRDRVEAGVGRGEVVEEIALPVGLVLLIGPPAAGKSSFVRAWIEQGRIDRDGVVSCDAIRAEIFGGKVRTSDDPAVFDEMDARIAARLAVGDPVVVDATNVTAEARARMHAWAKLHDRPISALRFSVETSVLIARNSARTGHQRVPIGDVLRSAATFRAAATHEQLHAEGIDVVMDVPGGAQNLSPAGAAEHIHFTDRLARRREPRS